MISVRAGCALANMPNRANTENRAQSGIRQVWIAALLCLSILHHTVLHATEPTSSHSIADAAIYSSLYAPLLGQWGTDDQCARSLLLPTGTKHATPFDIRPGWLVQGEMWCRLSWGIAAPSERGLFALATALCGEDTTRAYEVRFRLQADQLTLIWGLWNRHGPLKRCVD